MNMQRVRINRVDNPMSVKEFAVDAATEIEVGDLCWIDSDDVKPASATELWSTDGDTTISRLAKWFVGVAVSSHQANDTKVTTVRVAGRGVAEFPLNTPTTLEIGNLIGGVKAAGNALEDQVVKKVTNREFAIGRVFKRGTSLSQAMFEFAGRADPGALFEGFITGP